MLKATVHDLTRLGSVLNLNPGRGQSIIQTIDLRFGVSDPDKYRYRARVSAIADAKAQANQLASAAGMAHGALIALSETAEPAITPVVFDRLTLMTQTAEPAATYLDQPIKITDDVTAIYALSEAR